MYIDEINNGRVQVLDSSGHFIRAFGKEGEGKLSSPSGLHIADKHVYVSDIIGNCIVVYETSGKFVTRFGGCGRKEGELWSPYCITSCVDGFIRVCDCSNYSEFCTLSIISGYVISLYAYTYYTVSPI